MQPLHILERLKLPSRFEPLKDLIGPSVVKVLVDPGEQEGTIRRLVIGCRNANEGFFWPLLGKPGVGKTTLAQNLSFFFPKDFAPTLLYRGPVTRDSLAEGVTEHRDSFPADDRRILPINVDHREKDAPNDAELAVLKSFLRETVGGSPNLIIWPTTDDRVARDMADRFKKITGSPFIEIPHQVAGPPKETWRDTVLNTMALCNSLPPEEIRELGVDPNDYEVSRFHTIGDLMKQISIDFSANLATLLGSLSRQVSLVVVFPSESLDRGVLTEFTHGNEPGLLDSHALLKACPKSRIGKWWSDRRGALTQTIFRSNARCYWVSPAATVSVLRRYGPDPVRKILSDMGIGVRSPADIRSYLERSDLGKFLLGETESRYVTQGRPPAEARDALAFVGADYGYGSGRDKQLNAAMARGIEDLLDGQDLPPGEDRTVMSEVATVPPIIPDASITQGSSITCIEFAWRSGDALASGNRSEIAQYILTKLKNYSLDLGWVSE